LPLSSINCKYRIYVMIISRKPKEPFNSYCSSYYGFNNQLLFFCDSLNVLGSILANSSMDVEAEKRVPSSKIFTRQRLAVCS